MKKLRKNIDLDSQTVAVLQIEATLKGHGSLKPFLEKLLMDYAIKCMGQRKSVYKELVKNQAGSKVKVKKSRVKRLGSVKRK